MKMDLYINEANDYARDIGAPVLHPHVAIIHYDEVGEIRHSMNRINCYGIFLQREFPENLTYGIGTYNKGEGSLMAYSPGQIGGKRDDGTRKQYHGWVLLFDATFIHDTDIERRLSDYHFFSYNSNEALILDANEKKTLATLMEKIHIELRGQRAQRETSLNRAESRQKSTESQLATDNEDDLRDDIVRDYIRLILDYCKRFYARQLKEFILQSRHGTAEASFTLLSPSHLKEMTAGDSNILARFQQILTDYYEKGKQRQSGLPSVKYCASEMCFSAGYFGDIVRGVLSESPKDYIRGFVIHRAKNLILSGKNIAQVADELGFQYPNHFTRMFKNVTGQTPSEFLDKQRKKIVNP